MAILGWKNFDGCICMNSYDLFSENEIEFDLIGKRVILFNDFSNAIPYLSPEASEGNEEPDVFPLGESVISFMELDFEKYNTILSDFVQRYLEYNSPCNPLHYIDVNTFIASLYDQGIEHPYFNSLNVNGVCRTIDEFKSLMTIDSQKIYRIRRFLIGLCGSAYPVENPKNKYCYREALSEDLEMIFSDTSPMETRLLCEAHMDCDSHITKVASRLRYKNVCPMSFCITELSKMIESGIQIRLCKNCNRFFIPQNNHSSEYCNRTCNKKGQTCKEIGAQKQYKNKVKSNPILKEYEKAYKRNYAKVSRGDMSKDMFVKWTEEAIAKREKATIDFEKSQSQNIITDFKNFLGNK